MKKKTSLEIRFLSKLLAIVEILRSYNFTLLTRKKQGNSHITYNKYIDEKEI